MCTVPCFKIGKMVPYQNSSRNSGRFCRYFCCYFGTYQPYHVYRTVPCVPYGTIFPILKHGTVRYGTHGTVGTVHMVRLVRHIGTASPVGTVHWHNKFKNHTWARCVTRIVPCAMCRYNISVLYRTIPYICTMTSSCVPYHVPYHVPR